MSWHPLGCCSPPRISADFDCSKRSDQERNAATVDEINVLLGQIVDDMKKYHDEREQALRIFIHHELKSLEDAIPMLVGFLQSGEARAAKQALREGQAELHTTADGVADRQLHAIVPSDAAEVHAYTDADHGPHNTIDRISWNTNPSTIGEEELYMQAIKRNRTNSSCCHDLLGIFADRFLPEGPPDTLLARSTEHWLVKSLSFLAIISNTALMGFETDINVKVALKISSEAMGTIDWLSDANIVFTCIFLFELLYRMIALRLWFFLAPGEWMWNLLDVFLVGISLVTDIFGGINMTFARSLRLYRVVRVFRVVRVVRLFRDLRKMLLSILACLQSLGWCFFFLMILNLMASIFFLQGVIIYFDTHPDSESDVFREHYSSLLRCMYALLKSILGADWVTIQQPLNSCGWAYEVAFLGYIFFVNVGIMNVLTGVFLSSAADFMDRDLAIQDANAELDKFVQAMLSVFDEVVDIKSGRIHKEEYFKAMTEGSLEAYLASEGLEPLHSHLLWDLLDEDESGTLSLEEFIVGAMRLKGPAKAIDVRVIQQALQKSLRETTLIRKSLH